MPLVEDATGRRPFMRGIMVHSLLSRGASFDAAYSAATAVRDKIRGRESVRREELAQMVEEQLGGMLEATPEPALVPPAIQVRDDRAAGDTTPFSKGILAQSLLAAAIEPDDAFAVARDIETSLVARRVREISRDELRKIAQDTLGAKLGARVGQRYRAWRAFQETGKPLILLMGGAAGVGKSALAQSVATRLGITRVYSTDAIRQVMRIMLSKELMPEIHASSYDAHRSLPERRATSPDPVIDGFVAQASAVAVGVRAMIERAIEENTSMIMEGVSILPGLVDPARHAADAHVIFLAVSTLERDAFRSRFVQRASEAKQRATHRYLENLDAILRIQDHILELAEAQDLPIVDNRSFDDSVLSILRHVTESLRTQGDASASHAE
jgi:2-phosphoglycerate kinase